MNEHKRYRLIMITDTFPYGHGEPFLQTEIRYLAEHFHVTIICSPVSTAEQRPVDSSIDIIVYDKSLRDDAVLSKLKSTAMYLFSFAGWSEISSILLSRQKNVLRIKNSIFFFHSARIFHRWLSTKKLVDPGEKAIYYTYWENEKALAVCLNQKKYPFMKTVTRLHGYDLYNERRDDQRQPFKKYMDHKLNMLLFGTEYSMKYYLNTFNIRSGNRHAISPMGTENPYGMAPWKKQERMVLISCSSVIALKRVNLIIDALKHIKSFPISWTHFGSGEDFENIKSYANEQLSTHKNIEYAFTGLISNRELMTYYANEIIDCFITTSSTEGAPVSIMEALSYGIPVIATAVGGIPEMLADNRSILLAANPTPDEIAQALERLYNIEDEQTYELRQGCRKTWENRFDAQKNYLSLVKKLHDSFETDNI